MPSPDELRAQAKELYDQADKIRNADERLPVVLRALELELDADALERREPDSTPHVMGPLKDGGDRESA